MPELCAEVADARIRDLLRLVQSGRYDLLSLDVFDTVVWRMVPEPSDVFFLVAETLVRDGALYASSSPAAFVRARIDAEDRARKRSAGLEVTLDDIYREFPAGFLRGLAPADLIPVELAIERRIVRVFEPMRELIAEARARGLAVAFVSDTYFTGPQLRELVPCEADHWVLSCEHGMSKRLGLHRVVIERAGVDPGRILHVGDNYHADIEGAGAFPIDRYWFRKFPDAYADLPKGELSSFFNRRAPLVAGGDGGLTALRGQVMATVSDEHERWGAGVLGPVIAGFADWVIGRCETLGIETALCLMREGRILKQVIDLQGSTLEAREAYLSRFVALQASIFTADEAELRRFLHRPSRPTQSLLLTQLGLAPDALGEDMGEALSHRDIRDLARRIARDPRLRARVVAASAAVRARLLAHLGLARGRRVAIVDLGYAATIQGCLHRIFAHEGLGVETHGLYLVTGDDVRKTQAHGATAEGWLAANGQPLEMAHTFIRSPEIVEQSLMAPLGTTVGHQADGTPVLGRFVVPELQRQQIESVQRGIQAFAARWAAHKTSYGALEAATLERLMRAACIRIVARPLEVELDLFGHWQHDENFGSDHARALIEIEDLHPWEGSHMSAHQIASVPHTRLYWPAGFAHTVSPVMGDAVAHIYMRDAPPRSFDSAAPAERVVFLWDSGAGFNEREAEVRDLQLGNRNRAWTRFSLKIENGRCQAFGLAFAKLHQVVQLTGVRVHVRPIDGVTETHTFDPDRVTLHGFRHVHGNLYAIESLPAIIAVPSPALHGVRGVVHVDFFLGFIPET